MKYLLIMLTLYTPIARAGYRPISSFKQGPDYGKKKRCESIHKEACVKWGTKDHHESAILKPIYKNGDPIYGEEVACIVEEEITPISVTETAPISVAPISVTETAPTQTCFCPEGTSLIEGACLPFLGHEQIDTGRKRVGIDKVKKAEHLAAKKADKDAKQAEKDATMALKQKLKFTEPDLTPDQIKKIFRYLLRNLK